MAQVLWECYRTSLETLRNNARLEVIYQVRYALMQTTDTNNIPSPAKPSTTSIDGGTASHANETRSLVSLANNNMNGRLKGPSEPRTRIQITGCRPRTRQT
jgi:hypothetical protein